MMHALILDLELLDEVVISRTSATTGQHRCLPFIPGGTLIGALASVFYDEKDGRMYDIFYAGRVRFGDARPITPNQLATWPVPLAWHSDKGGGPSHDNARWMSQGVVSLVATSMKEIGFLQPHQVREGFVSASDEHVRPKTRYRMKTAIDRGTGSAAEGQLFGYEALARGQRFRATISADEASLLEPVREHLVKVLYLGRSRSAQYGRVKVLSLTAAQAPSHLPVATLAGIPYLVIWLASDLAVRDAATGMPTFTPSLADLGLADLVNGLPASDKTFVRTRRYRPYNAKRGTHDLERQVIAAGSVLCYRLEGMPDPQASERLTARMASGLGENREAGLGEVVLDPALEKLLLSPHPDFIEAATLPGRQEQRPAPAHPLVAWLRAGDNRDTIESNANRWAEHKLMDLISACASARRYNGVAAGLGCGPGASQWGRVHEAAIAQNEREALIAALMEGDSAICKPADEDWSMETGKAPGATYRSWLEAAVNEAFENGIGTRGVIRLAALARAEATQNRMHMNGEAA